MGASLRGEAGVRGGKVRASPTTWEPQTRRPSSPNCPNNFSDHGQAGGHSVCSRPSRAWGRVPATWAAGPPGKSHPHGEKIYLKVYLGHADQVRHRRLTSSAPLPPAARAEPRPGGPSSSHRDYRLPDPAWTGAVTTYWVAPGAPSITCLPHLPARPRLRVSCPGSFSGWHPSLTSPIRVKLGLAFAVGSGFEATWQAACRCLWFTPTGKPSHPKGPS